MLPLAPFAAGLIAGGLAVRWLRDRNMRAATQSSLATIESSTFASAPDQLAEDAAPVAKPKAVPRKKKAPAKATAATNATPTPKATAPRKRVTKPAKTPA